MEKTPSRFPSGTAADADAGLDLLHKSLKEL